MHTYIINATVLALCHSDIFKPSKFHPQGVQQVQKYELPDVKFWKSNKTYSSKVTKNIKMYNTLIIKSL